MESSPPQVSPSVLESKVLCIFQYFKEKNGEDKHFQQYIIL